jgi:selenocysteine lyase/cysteine desulfurase
MKHANGAPLAEVYGPTTTDSRGPTVAFNFLAPNGQIVDERIVMRAANKAHIALRTGCFCNPGASEIALEVRESRLRTKGIHTVMQHMPFDDFLGYLGLQSAGAIRLSLGFISNFTDIERFLQFAQTFRNLAPQASGLPPRTHC